LVLSKPHEDSRRGGLFALGVSTPKGYSKLNPWPKIKFRIIIFPDQLPSRHLHAVTAA
jgi:hypothetical protein